MSQKIACYKCSSKIEIPSGLEPLAKINCPQCQAEITVPYMIGELILEKKISENKFCKSYKAYHYNLLYEAKDNPPQYSQ